MFSVKNMINNPRNTITNALIGLAVGGAFFGLVHMRNVADRNIRKETQANMRDTYSAIGKSLELMKGTNNEVSVESGQDFLNSIGINYKLKTNEVISLDISMGDNWQDVYVGVRNKNAQGGGIIPGTTTRSNLQSYLNSHQN